jgi:hypothetical protein
MFLDFRAGDAAPFVHQPLVFGSQPPKRFADRSSLGIVAAQHFDRFGTLAARERLGGGGNDGVRQAILIGVRCALDDLRATVERTA